MSKTRNGEKDDYDDSDFPDVSRGRFTDMDLSLRMISVKMRFGTMNVALKPPNLSFTVSIQTKRPQGLEFGRFSAATPPPPNYHHHISIRKSHTRAHVRPLSE
ncbi:hypothetical protein PM082_008889 [Marasmius tenuissimus]|nr:hypothetical protein PM082_008889 [Marasmius tenuissimus]